MRKIIFTSVSLIITILFAACTQEEDFKELGGNLPTNYIIIQADGSLTPSVLSVASGSSITFVNSDTKPHHIISNDSTSIKTNIIASKSFYLFKNDTLHGVFPYRCLLDSNIKGTILITP